MRRLTQESKHGITLLLVFFLLGSVFVLIGVHVYHSQEESLQRSTAQELHAVADLKVRLVADWYAGRVAETHAINELPWLKQKVQQFLSTPTDHLTHEELLSWMTATLHREGYRRILLLDEQQHVRLAVPENETWLGERADLKAEEAMRTRLPVISDLHLSTVISNYVNMDWLVPVSNPSNPAAPPLAVFMMEGDPNDFLFPLIQEWPVPSVTAETMLLRREGNEVVFLNELRHRKESALKLRMPVNEAPLTEVMAARGQEGFVEGLDYRGKLVMAMIRQVPGTPWFLVAKIDHEEVCGPLRQLARRDGVMVLVLIALMGLVLLVWWRTREQRFLQQELATAERMAHLVKTANDIVLLFDENWNIVEANDRACERYGYSQSELLKLNIRDLQATEISTNSDLSISPSTTQGLLFESRHRRKDGTTFVVEASVRSFSLEGRRYYQSIIRDVTQQKQVATALQESRLFLHNILNSIPDPIFVRDHEHRLVLVNDAACCLLGQPREKQIGSTMYALASKEVAELYRQRNEEVLRSGKESVNESTITGADGRVHNLSTKTSRYVDLNGNKFVVGVIRDITERKKAEETTRVSEEKYKRLIETTRTGFVTIDEQGRVVDANPEYVRLTGCQRLDEILGHHVMEWTAPHDRERNLHEVKKCLEQGFVRFLEVDYQTSNGQLIPVEINATVFRVNGSIQILTLCRDISDRKQAEQERMRLITAIEQASETVVITDSEGNIQYANPSFERTSGYTVQEAIGKNPRLLKSGQHDAAFYRDMWETLKHGEVWHGHVVNKRKNGTLFREETTISPVRDKTGKIINYIALKLDVTHEAELQTQLRQAQKIQAVGQLAGGVAHDFNNLLNVILGYSELILQRKDIPPEARPQVEEVHRAGERAAALTRQLLAFSRKQILEPKVFEMGALVADMSKLLRRLIGEHIELHLVAAATPCWVKADPGQIEQVVMNLCVNARDAMPHGGKLTIETGLFTASGDDEADNPRLSPGEYVALSISDTGVGMSNAVKAHLFEPFFTTKEVGKGTGLGLATCYGIIKQSGGEIIAYSEPNIGTTFRIYLPSIPQEARKEHPAPPAPTVPRGKGETILLVEDEPSVRTLAALTLRELGYTVVTAEDGPTALRLARETDGEHIDLLLTDVVMPGMNGREVAAILQSSRPRMKVLFISGYTDDTIIRQGVLEPGVVLLPKPFTSIALASKVHEMLNSQTLSDEGINV